MVSIDMLQGFFHEIHLLIHSHDFQHKYTLQKNAFSRKRKLTFACIISFLLSLPKKSLVTELDLLFEKMEYSDSPSKQAFSLARQKISYHAFEELFYQTTYLNKQTSSSEGWYGHRILAVDGTTLSVPSSPETIAEFGVKKWYSKQCVIPKVSVLYDITNDLIADVIFGEVRSDEREHASRLMDSPYLKSSFSNKSILLFDRGYPSRKIVQELHGKEMLYLMRCSTSFLACVNNAPLGDHIVIDNYKGIETTLRVIKFPLESGEIEMLITNILDSDRTMDDFKNLYFLRWGIETKYGELKNRLLIEKFCGKKPECIRQEFYAHLFMANIISFIKKQSDKAIKQEEKKKDLKRNYQTNRSYLAGLATRAILFLLLQKKTGLIVELLQKAYKKRSPLRPNRKCERSGAQYRKTFDMNLKTHL